MDSECTHLDPLAHPQTTSQRLPLLIDFRLLPVMAEHCFFGSQPQQLSTYALTLFRHDMELPLGADGEKVQISIGAFSCFVQKWPIDIAACFIIFFLHVRFLGHRRAGALQ